MQDHDTATIVIRPAYPDDAAALARLAALDSARVPSGPMVVAEVGGQLRVARAAFDGAVIADPFFPTAQLISLLEVRAGGRAVGLRTRRRARWRLSPA